MKDKAMRNILKNKIDLSKVFARSQVGQEGNHKNNLANLKFLIKYISNIKTQGLIDDEKFKLLLAGVCQNFIENEIETRINKKVLDSLGSQLGYSQNVTK